MDPRLEEAVRIARLGDPRAFGTLMDHLGPPLVRYLTRFLSGDGHAARDVAQETLLRAWSAMGDMRDAAHLRRWCRKVGRYRAISWLRRKTPPGRRMLSLDAAPRGLLPGDGHRRERPASTGRHPPPWRARAASSPDPEEVAALKRALDELPESYAGAVELHYFRGLTTHETARLLGIPRGAVKMRLLRARRFLRKRMEGSSLASRSQEFRPRRRPGS